MWDKIMSVFGFKGVSESALKIVDKIAGTDWTPQEKAEYILKYHEATKHQSPTRRFLALVITFTWVFLVLVWVVSSLLANYVGVSGADDMVKDVLAFMDSNINVSFNLLVSFYYLIHMKK